MKPLVWIMIRQRSNKSFDGFLILLLFLLFIFYAALDKNRGSNSVTEYKTPVFVMLEGETCRPGVYSFYEGNNLSGSIKAAVLNNSINMPGLIHSETELESGTSLKIMKDETGYLIEKGQMSAFYKITLGIPVSLNSESESGLTAIPGIGPSLARTINEGRIRSNGFSDIHELETLPGIGKKLLKRISPYIGL